MVRKLLLDTSILIEELRLPKEETRFKESKKLKYKLFICAITLTELWAGQSIKTSLGQKRVKELLKDISIIDLGEKILKKAGEELRKDKNLFLGDALIAATGIVKKLPLLTLNERHFQKIEDLKLFKRD